jgi:hypothetical protein
MFSSWLLKAFPLQMMRETHKSSFNVHYHRQIIVAKIFIDDFAFLLLESIVLALLSRIQTENFCREKNQPNRRCYQVPKVRSATILISKTGRKR